MPDQRPVLSYETPHRRSTDVISISARVLVGLVLLLASGVVFYLAKIDADVASFSTLSINITIGLLLAVGAALCVRAAFTIGRSR